MRSKSNCSRKARYLVGFGLPKIVLPYCNVMFLWAISSRYADWDNLMLKQYIRACPRPFWPLASYLLVYATVSLP